jgi:hypothetical protein
MVRFLVYFGSGYATARAIEAAVYKIPIGLTLRFPFTSVAKIRDMYIAAQAAKAVPAAAAAAVVPAPITQTPPAPLSGWGANLPNPHHRRRRRTRRQIQRRTQSMMTAPGAQAQQALWAQRQRRAA